MSSGAVNLCRKGCMPRHVNKQCASGHSKEHDSCSSSPDLQGRRPEHQGWAQGNRARSHDTEAEAEMPSVFDAPEGEATCLFVNPFACNCSPLDWRQLQARPPTSSCHHLLEHQ